MTRRSDLVHERLRGDILDGTLAPGDAVPSERALAEELGVNRHAVREALKRLEQAGLVRISQGGATRVQDWRETGGIEVLLDLVDQPGGVPPRDLLRAVLEFREAIGVDAAGRCAARGEAAGREAVAALAEATAAAVGGEGVALDDRYRALWRAIVTHSGNVAYLLAFNSLVAALGATPEVLSLTLPRDAGAVSALGAAIAGGDEAGARAAAEALLGADSARA